MILFATTTVVFSHFSGVLEFIFDSIVNYQTGHFITIIFIEQIMLIDVIW